MGAASPCIVWSPERDFWLFERAIGALARQLQGPWVI